MEKKASSAPLASGALVVLQHREEAKRMRLGVGILLVALVCPEDT
jgi:hypothetical protein